MKKSLIATGAASLALAAMPVVGAFAVQTSVTDTLTVTVDESCTIINDVSSGVDTGTPTTANAYTLSMAAGELRSDIGTGATGVTGTSDNELSVSCNVQSGTDAGWSLRAAGKNGSTDLADASQTSNPTPIETGLNTTAGDGSSWAFKIKAGTGNTVTFQTGYADDTFAAVPSGSGGAKVAVGTGNATLTVTYQVFVDQDQAPGTYTGGVVYTLTNPAES